MTLVCSPAYTMPTDHFTSGVDVMYPQHLMNPHQMPESEWNSHSPLEPSPYESRPPLPPFTASQEALSSSLLSDPYPAPHRPPPMEINSLPHHLQPLSRPKSSPSTFGPNVEDIVFTEDPFRMRSNELPPAIFTLSPQPATLHHSKLTDPYYPASEYAASNASYSPLRRPIPIAPDPVGLNNMNALKRAREDEETSEYGIRKRKRAASQSGPVELNEEEQFLIKLKEEENLPWKDIAVRFQSDMGKSFQVPALQMRYKRLRERMRTWTETDVSD